MSSPARAEGYDPSANALISTQDQLGPAFKFKGGIQVQSSTVVSRHLLVIELDSDGQYDSSFKLDRFISGQVVSL